MVDIACGDGNVLRYFTDNTDKYKIDGLGIDMSLPQIQAAQQMSDPDTYPFINYEVGKAEELHDANKHAHLHATFDVALLFWCYCYAPTVHELQAMMQSVYSVLKPHGFAIGITVSSEKPHELCQRYGIDYKGFGNDVQDADLVHYVYDDVDLPVFFYHPNTYQSVSKRCGFTAFQFLNDATEYVANPALNNVEQRRFLDFKRTPNAAKVFWMRK